LSLRTVRPHRRWLLRMAVLLALLPAGAPRAQTALHDDRGKVIDTTAPPQRIVSLVPSLTESICTLGECARLVGTDRFSNWPAEVRSLPKLGGLDDAQVERIAGLRPDLVLAAPSARAVERLEAVGLKVLVLHSRSHQDVKRSLQLLAALFGEASRANATWREIERQMTEAAARVPPALRGRSVYFEVESSPYAAGPTSFIGQTLLQLGLKNIVPATLGPFPKLSPEFVVRAQPDIVIAESRNLRDMAQRPGWAALRALQQQQVCDFSSERYEVLVRPGPRMGLAARQLADCLAGLGKDAR
jgi:iron complex transport system substrate-binding protein